MTIAHYYTFIISVVLYFLASFWSIGSIFKPRRFSSVVTKLFVITGFTIHSFYMIFLGIQSGSLPVSNIFESMSFLVWCIILIFIVIDLLYKTPSVLIFLMPFVTAFSIWSISFIGNDLAIPNDLSRFWLFAHIVPTFFGYASFGISFIASIMYIIQQKQLRSNFTGTLSTRLPSLEGLDALIWRTLSFGFPLITLGLIFGFIWVRSSNALGDDWFLDHKVVLGIVAWLVYAAILHIRMIASFHGRKVAILTISGFVLIIFTFVGTFSLGSKHGFQNVSENDVIEKNINY
ncbi:MAG: cytochrome C assembly family protein [Candidatus Anammoxibacter sp.]